MAKPKSPANKLEQRKKLIESLYNRRKITDFHYDQLLTAAMVDAGAITFEEMLEQYTINR